MGAILYRKPTSEQCQAIKRALDALPTPDVEPKIPSVDQLIASGLISEEQREMIEKLRAK